MEKCSQNLIELSLSNRTRQTNWGNYNLKSISLQTEVFRLETPSDGSVLHADFVLNLLCKSFTCMNSFIWSNRHGISTLQAYRNCVSEVAASLTCARNIENIETFALSLHLLVVMRNGMRCGCTQLSRRLTHFESSLAYKASWANIINWELVNIFLFISPPAIY